MRYFRLENRGRLLCAFLAAALLLPRLVLAEERDWRAYNNEQRWVFDDERCLGDHDGDGGRDRHIATVPEGGPGIALLAATLGAILVLGVKQASRKPA
jgi:hypothetical protein